LGSQAESLAVRRRGSVMTNRVSSQDRTAERSAVFQIRLEDRGCRPNHRIPRVSQESLVATVEGRPAGPPANGAHGLADSAPPAREVHKTSILRQPIEPVIARWLATGLTVDPERWLAARLGNVESRHPPTERPGRKARCGRWQLTGSVTWPQGWMAWKADTRRQKDLAAGQGVDVGS
jgi:hypothetical protein